MNRLQAGQYRRGHAGTITVDSLSSQGGETWAMVRAPDTGTFAERAHVMAIAYPEVVVEVGQRRRDASGKLDVAVADYIPSYEGPWVIRMPWGTSAYLRIDELLAEYPEAIPT